MSRYFSLKLFQVMILMILILFTQKFQSQKINIKAWVENGYYYEHRCQVTFQVISDLFVEPFQIFHLLTKQNSSFFHTQNSLNPTFVKGANDMQTKFLPQQDSCKFKTSTNYYCALIYTEGYNPLNIIYYQTVNSTHRKLTFRVNRVICPTENSIMSFQVRMPAPEDYDKYYFYVPQLFKDYQPINDPGLLTFIYDKQVIVDISKLTYKQLNIFQPEPVNYLIGCKFNYKIKLRFDNVSYYDTFDQIEVIISNYKILQISDQCQSNFMKNYTCEKTSTGYKLINLNQTDLLKSYQINDWEFYEYSPFEFNINFVASFLSSGLVNIEVVCRSFNNKIRENWLNMTHKTSEIYGRKVQQINGLDQMAFQKIQAYSTKLDPLSCITPIHINSTSNSNLTENTTDSTKTTNSTSQQFSFKFTETTTNNTVLLFIPFFILVLSITLYCRKQMFLFQKLLYIALIFILSLVKVVYLCIGIDSSYLTNTPEDSLFIKNQDSLELFIIKYTFIIQIVLNVFYFLTYVLLLIFSKEISMKIKKFYGTTFFKDGNERKKCNISSFIFCFATFLFFLLSYKFYALFVYKMHLNSNQQKVFKKYRFKNTILYKIHEGHLCIDLFLQINLIVWIYLLSEYCQNTNFDYFLYILLLFYCTQVYLMVLVLKSFYNMSKKSNQINDVQNNKIKCQSELITSNYDIEIGNSKDQKRQEVQNNIEKQQFD